MIAFLSHPFWTWVTIGSVALGLFACILFVTRFIFESGADAWRNPFGRYLLMRKTLLAALFTLVLINVTVGDYPGRRAMTACLMMAFALQTFIPYRLLVDAQKAHAREKDKKEEVQK